jgi:hypothetical protein
MKTMRMRVPEQSTEAEHPVVAKKPGNAGGAKEGALSGETQIVNLKREELNE